MLFDFPVVEKKFDIINNYELFMLPNGIYRAARIRADNYLYPMYFMKENGDYVISTSVYALIHYKRRFVRHPRFQTAHFYRPSFRTIDEEIRRERTVYRRSTLELADKDEIVALGARLIQDYVTEIEKSFPGYAHLLLLGGKDSANIVLAKRRAPWIVLTGEPSVSINMDFIRDNGINIERFVPVSNDTDDEVLSEEIMASDCMFDVAHFRWTKVIRDIVKEYNRKVVLWMGTDGDGIFSRNNNHLDKDYYAHHDLHVGTAMGVWHQMLKNFLNIPVVSPYQSPSFLNTLFYRFDPYFVLKSGDVRSRIGEILFGRPVKYPPKNLTPQAWNRNRMHSIDIYIRRLKDEGIVCATKPVRSWLIEKWARTESLFDNHSCKERSPVSKILYPLRNWLGRIFPPIRNKRHEIAATEIF